MKKKIVHLSIIGIFCSLYFLVATISMINSVEFFDLAHSGLMSWSLALGFELGAAASLAAIVILERTNRTMVWALFLLLTAFQMMANSYHAFVNLEDYMGWIELFGLHEEEVLFQKRILSVISGAVLPVVALGFIKSLIDYIRPSKDKEKYFDQSNTEIEKRVKENQIHIDNIQEEGDYDSEGNLIIPPLTVKSGKTEERKAESVKATPPNPETPPKNNPTASAKTGRKIVGKYKRPNVSSKTRS